MPPRNIKKNISWKTERSCQNLTFSLAFCQNIKFTKYQVYQNLLYWILVWLDWQLWLQWLEKYWKGGQFTINGDVLAFELNQLSLESFVMLYISIGFCLMDPRALGRQGGVPKADFTLPKGPIYQGHRNFNLSGPGVIPPKVVRQGVNVLYVHQNATKEPNFYYFGFWRRKIKFLLCC